jgi:hypothetical protein
MLALGESDHDKSVVYELGEDMLFDRSEEVQQPSMPRNSGARPACVSGASQMRHTSIPLHILVVLTTNAPSFPQLV